MRGFLQKCANYGPLTNQRVAQKMIRAESPVESRHDANRRPLIPEQLLFQRKSLMVKIRLASLSAEKGKPPSITPRLGALAVVHL
jgi:hypothetical protein